MLNFSLYVGTKKYSLSTEDEVMNMYPDEFKAKYKILIGSKDILRDIQNGYKKIFESSIEKYNKNSKEKIKSYYCKINESKKLSLATAILIKISEESLEDFKNDIKIIELFRNQLNKINELIPNYFIVSAILYWEKSLTLRIIGIPYKKDENKKLEVRLAKSECFNKKSIEILRNYLKVQAKSDYFKAFFNKLDIQDFVERKVHLKVPIEITQLTLFPVKENTIYLN